MSWKIFNNTHTITIIVIIITITITTTTVKMTLVAYNNRNNNNNPTTNFAKNSTNLFHLKRATMTTMATMMMNISSTVVTTPLLLTLKVRVALA